MPTSPVPDAAAPPGMCPGIVVLSGGMDDGGGSGNAKGGKNGKGGGGKGNGEGASGDEKKGGCAEGDPICPITGRMFLTIYDFGIGGPFPLRFLREYNSRGSSTDSEFGWGWSHSFGWRILVRQHAVEVFDDRARKQIFHDVPREGKNLTNGLGWTLSRDNGEFVLRIGAEGLTYRFGIEVRGGWHHLISVADRNGNTIQVQRDAKGKLQGLIDSVGRPVRFTTDAKSRVTHAYVATEATHQQWMEVARYTYDELGNLASVIDAEGYSAEYRYDDHLMVEHRSPSGLSYFYRYDGKGADAFCIESWGEYVGKTDPALDEPILPRPEGHDTRKVKGIHYVKLTYLKDQRYTEVENGLGGVTRYFGDELGRAIKIVDAAGGVTDRDFDRESGGLVSEHDASDRAREIDCDTNGTACGFRDSHGNGILTTIADDDTEITHYSHTDTHVRRRYDDRGHLIFVAHPDGTFEEWHWDNRGLLKTWVNRRGGTTVYVHDAMGCCTQIRHPDGSVEDNEYDYLGRRIAHHDEARRKTEWVWDRRSEPVVKRYPDGTEARAVYDANRKIVHLEDAGRITRIEYGGMAWPVRVERPGGVVTEYRYDVIGHIVRVRNARGEDFRIERDHAGRAIAYETFEGVRHEVGWNSAQEEIWMRSALGHVEIERDAQQRVASMSLPDQKLVFSYSPNGLTGIDNGVIALERNLDMLGRVVMDRQGDHKNDVTWSHGDIVSIVSDVGLPIAFRHDAAGELKTLQVGTTKVHLDEQVGTDLLTYLGEGLVLRRHYGDNGQLLRQSLARRSEQVPQSHAATSADPGLLFWASYEYDTARYLRREYRSDGRRIEYDLDAAGHIVRKSVYRNDKLEQEERIGYDPGGSPRMAAARYDARMRPIALHDESFEYDDAGRLTRRLTDAGEWRYEWNTLDQLVRVHAPHRMIEMDYDARGRRMRKRVYRQRELQSSTSYVWANELVLHEVDDLSGTTRTYVRPNDEWTIFGHVDVRTGEARETFYVTSPIGGIDLAVDAAGRVVWAADQTVFGNATPTIAQVDVSLRFPNQHYDADLELVYNRHRWYDPRLGLFISTDPLLLKGNLNTREYVPNPLKYVDPMGATTTLGAGKFAKKKKDWETDEFTGETYPGYIDCPEELLHTSKSSDFNKIGGLRDTIDEAGKRYGCHTCGSKKPGTKSGHFVPDHQPPKSTYSSKNLENDAEVLPSSGNVRLYPQCIKCSKRQRSEVRNMTNKEKAVKGQEIMKTQQEPE